MSYSQPTLVVLTVVGVKEQELPGTDPVPPRGKDGSGVGGYRSRVCDPEETGTGRTPESLALEGGTTRENLSVEVL